MTIGILTYHWVANFGANLQAISTYRNIMLLGHEPIIINWVPFDTEQWYVDACGKHQLNIHQSFISSECKMTRMCRNSNDVKNVIKENDIMFVIIGSDSLWNITHQKSATSDHCFPNPFWGEGIPVPHAALSVSCQNAAYDDWNEKECIKFALSNFDIITVRDSWTKSMVTHFVSQNVHITPDPVFAYCETPTTVDKAEITNRYGISNRYVLFCFNRGRYFKLHHLWLRILKKLYNRRGIMCVNLSRNMYSEPLYLDKTINMPICPNDWYYLIKYADAYIGVMMHPIIVCLHNSVPFFSFDHYGIGKFLKTDIESSKIFHIIKEAGLLNYYHSLRNHIFFPAPWRVIKSLDIFPKEKCKKFADSQQTKFITTLRYIINYYESK